MKKHILAFIFLFSVAPLLAQPVTRITDKNDLRQEIARIFQKEQETRAQETANAFTQFFNASANKNGQSSVFQFGSKNSPRFHAGKVPASRNKAKPAPNAAKNPWQIAMFLAAQDRPFGETLGTVRWLVKHGHLRRAALVSIPENAKKDVTLYFIYAAQGKAVTNTMQIPVNLAVEDLLVPLFKGLEAEKDLYTGIIVDAHGSGMEMFYGAEEWMEPKELVESLKSANLTADILNIDACHMASFYTTYQIAQYKNVKYLVASSDFTYNTSEKMYYLLLNNLQYEPKTAAINTTRQMKNLLNFTPEFDVNNSVTLDLQVLHEPLQDWFNSYGVLVLNSRENLKKLLEKPFNPRLGEVRSLHKIIRQQIDVLEKMPQAEEDLSPQACTNWNAMKETFIAEGRALLQALDDSLLTQWCYSPQTNRLYNGKIPPNIDCSDGISVTKDQMDTLFNANKRNFHQVNNCHYWPF